MNGIKPMLVVAVDDDPVFIRHMAGAARFHGIPFAGFSSPREAYRELPRLNPGVAIVDYDREGSRGFSCPATSAGSARRRWFW